MDEFAQRRFSHSLALLTALICAGTTICAGSSLRADERAQQETSFRSLIAQGWNNSDRPAPTELSTDPPLAMEDESAGAAPLAVLIRQPTDPMALSDLKSIDKISPPIAPETNTEAMDNTSFDSSPTASAQVVRLRESARLSLRKSQQRLQRRATHSAKMYANESLRAVVAMQDADQGGNVHAKQFSAAMDAIRESRDFGVRFGILDQSTLERMVAAHTTEILKDVDLGNVSAIEATEAYLGFARDSLIQAANGAREASDALTILGRVERETVSPDNSHALAIAMTMQQAAVAIAPNNMLAHLELGTTYGRQGLMDQASQALIQSLQIQPTQTAYERLLEVSRRTGDIDTVQACITALRSGNLPSEIPVRTISPKQFAQTHRPTPASIQRSTADQAQTKAKPTNVDSQVDSEHVRISLRSILPFGRR